MSFFSKIKQMLGIGTVKVTLIVPGTFSTNDGKIDGTINLVAKSDQTVVSLKVELKEDFTTGRGEDKKTKTYEIGEIKLPGFDMKAGDVKDITFSLPFSYTKTSTEALSEMGGVLGGIGKLGNMASSDKSAFRVLATCDVKGASLDPNDSVEIRRVK